MGPFLTDLWTLKFRVVGFIKANTSNHEVFKGAEQMQNYFRDAKFLT